MKKIVVSFIALCLGAILVSCGGSHSHEYGEWTVSKDATCLHDGEETRKCECGEIETRTKKSTGHVQGEWVVTKEPTCTSKGVRKAFCTFCEKTMEKEDLPVAEHDYIVAKINTPTCTTKGSTRYECKNCDAETVGDYVDELGHDCQSYDRYNFDTTFTKNGTVSGDCSRCSGATKELEGSAELLRAAFAGKKISILGDSISTFYGVSDGAAADTTNSTIRDSVLYYDEAHAAALGVTRESTWWQKTADALGAEILVNNSWSGSYIKDASTNTRSTPGAYLDRCVNLHDNTGANAGTKPDIIIVYMGTNDYYKYKTNHGTADSVDYESLSTKTGSSYTPSSVAEAYAIMLYKMALAYPDAEIYCLNVLESGSSDATLVSFNAMIKGVAENVGAKYVDIAANSGIMKGETYEQYVPSDDGDGTPNTLHPNSSGMEAIAKCVIEAILAESKYLPDMSTLMD